MRSRSAYWINARTREKKIYRRVLVRVLREIRAGYWRLRDLLRRWDYYQSIDLGSCMSERTSHKSYAVRDFGTKRPWATHYDLAIWHEGYQSGHQAATCETGGSCATCLYWHPELNQKGFCGYFSRVGADGYKNVPGAMFGALYTHAEFGCKAHETKLVQIT